MDRKSRPPGSADDPILALMPIRANTFERSVIPISEVWNMREYIGSIGNWTIIAGTLIAAAVLVWALLTRSSLQLRPAFIPSRGNGS